MPAMQAGLASRALSWREIFGSAVTDRDSLVRASAFGCSPGQRRPEGRQPNNSGWMKHLSRF